MSQDLPEKVVEQMKNAGLPTGGTHPFKPKLTTNKRGDPIIDKKAAQGAVLTFADASGRRAVEQELRNALQAKDAEINRIRETLTPSAVKTEGADSDILLEKIRKLLG